MHSTAIATHRGLDPEREDSLWPESSAGTFRDHLSRGFCIEFDVQRTSSNELYVSHHAVTEENQANTPTPPRLEEILQMLAECSGIGALHVKHFLQADDSLALLSEALAEFPQLHSSLLLFDLSRSAGEVLRSRFPTIKLAQSVSHPFDIERYNPCVGGTLVTLEQAVSNRDVFDWIWLDEWDIADAGGTTKTLYNAETFRIARQHGFRIALVSPELHASSPGLLGNEAHPDGRTLERITTRMAEIILLKPDLICTDYPDRLRSLLK